MATIEPPGRPADGASTDEIDEIDDRVRYRDDGPLIPVGGAPAGRRRHWAAVAAATLVVGFVITGAVVLRDSTDPTVTSGEGEDIGPAAGPAEEPDPAPEPAPVPTTAPLPAPGPAWVPDPSTVPEVGPVPAPDQVARVHEVFGGVAEAHSSGWRWALTAESVVCWFPEGPSGTSASEFPLEEAMVAQHAVDECLVGNDWARSQDGSSWSEPVPCAVGAGLGLHVLLDGRACEDLDPDAHPLTDDDLVTINRRRAAEVAILAAPQDCATADETVAWAQAVVDRNGLDLVVGAAPATTSTSSTTVAPGTGPAAGGEVGTLPISHCHLGQVDWAFGVVNIQQGMH